jgi:hypothetical protein
MSGICERLGVKAPGPTRPGGATPPAYSPVTRPFGELAAANNRNFGAIGDEASAMRAPIPLVPPVITATFLRVATWLWISRAESGKVS